DSDQKDKPEKNENQPPQRASRGQRPGKPPVKIPQEVKEQLVERKGFANYHFNLAEQNAFIDALRNQFPATEKPGQPPLKDEKKGWLITGETDQTPAEPVKIQTTADKMSLQIGQKTYEIDKRSEMYDVVTDGTVAGLLPALDAWRRMLIDGPRKFGESYYLGTMPLGGERPLRDVMVGIAGELEIRWLSHPDTGAVEAIEVFADRDEDPAELWLLREPNAKAMPSVLDLRYGTDSILKVKVKSWKEVPASELEWSAEKKNANNTGNLKSKRAVGALQNTTDKNEVKA
ncbi:MAG: hypothetical protein L7W43_20360, partial [Rubripirellula sp.]|nr:hypothetical protein [Rubripirellula sp.]